MTGGGHDLEARAVRVCERAYDAWFSCRGSSDLHIPLSVLAAFLLAGGINGPHLLKSPDAEVWKRGPALRSPPPGYAPGIPMASSPYPGNGTD